MYMNKFSVFMMVALLSYAVPVLGGHSGQELLASPSAEEILASGGFLSTHQVQDRDRESVINRSFLRAAQAWTARDYQDAKRMFREHVADHPDSPWAAEAYLHLGSDALNNMRFTEAEEAFSRVLEQNRKSGTETAKLLANRARVGLGNVKMSQHNLGEARTIFAELNRNGSDWRERTYASHWLHQLSGYERKKLEMRNCGAWALAYLVENQGEKEEAEEIRELLPETPEGHSLKDLHDIAADYGYDLDVRRIPPEKIRELPLPAVMHVKNRTEGDIGHFWILRKVEGEVLTFFVAKEGLQFQQSFDEFLKEWSGAVLVPAKENLPGIALTESEMATVFGGNGGGGGPRYEDSLGNCKDKKCKKGPSVAGGGSSLGAPTWFVNMVNFNLYATDTPLWYASPIGPPVEIKLSYNSQSATMPNEPFGNKWQFNYAGFIDLLSGGQVAVFMPDGARDIYVPDGTGGYTRPYAVFNTLVKISPKNFRLTLPDGTTYLYDIPPLTTSPYPLLTEIRNAYGQKLSFSHDSNSRLTTITDAAGKVTSLTYNAAGLVERVTDPFTRFATFSYDANKNLKTITDMGGYSSSFTYDINVYLKSIASAAGTWGFTIEPADLVLSVPSYPAPGAPMGDNYRVTITNPVGGKEEYFYSSDWGQGHYVSPDQYVPYLDATTNNLTMAKKIAYSYPFTVTLKGQIETISSPTHSGLTYTYDASGNVLTKTDQSGHVTSYTYNAMGRLTSVIDPKGTVTNLTYAANNVDLTGITNSLGVMAVTYNSAHDVTASTDRMGNTVSYAYNTYGQLTTATDPLNIATNYLYDANHFLTSVTRNGTTLKSFTYDTVGRKKTFTDENGFTVTLAYNNLNDVTKVTYPDGKFITVNYSAVTPHLVTLVTDRAGRTLQYGYNLLQQLTQVVNAELDTVTFERDGNGNTTKLSDTNGNSTSFAYDAGDRLQTKTYADGTYVTYTYTADNLPSQDEGVSFTYDENRNITSYGTGGTFAYDSFNRRSTMQQYDDITQATTGYTYAYDANSRVTSIDGPLDNDTISFLYDAKGRTIGLSVQGGQAVTYTYDALDRVTGIAGPAGAYTYTYAAASSLPQKLTRPGGSYTEYQYDIMKRLTSVANKTSAGAVISSYVYTYNGQDLRAGETITGGAPTGSFDYESATFTTNNLNQILTATGPYATVTYSYDTNGSMNREEMSGGSDRFFSFRDNRLYRASQTKDTYYSYNGDDFLIKKQVKNGALVENETRYVRLGALVLQERDDANAVIREYTWGPGAGGIGGLLNLAQSGQNYSYLYDGKGNVTSVINSSQAVAAAYSYDPFGNLMAKTGTLNQPYRFSTKPYDENTGLYYYGYRFYQPSIGRWLNRDPLRERGGMNLYGFVGNNPVSNVDPYGLEVQVCWASVFGFGGGSPQVASHTWITTEQYPLGRGMNRQDWSIVAVEWSDQSSKYRLYKNPGEIQCQSIPDVDEECVNSNMDGDLGRYFVGNTCQDAVNQVLNKCSKFQKEPPRQQLPPKNYIRSGLNEIVKAIAYALFLPAPAY
jgi:RHS repeat-associated protein